MIRCKKCGGKLKPKMDFFKQNGKKHFEKMKENFKKEFCEELEELKGYNCCTCGACYSENFKREKWSVRWLKND